MENIHQLIKEKTGLTGAKQIHALRFLHFLSEQDGNQYKELSITFLNKFFKSAQTRIVVIKELLEAKLIEKTFLLTESKHKAYRLNKIKDIKDSQKIISIEIRVI